MPLKPRPARLYSPDDREAHRRAIRLWLYGVALLVFAMVVVGGATRLTGSGLSITEWKPVSGAIPPLTTAQWQAAFADYQQIPQYKLLNAGMSLGDFQFIYWWEWSHRQLGRLIGFAFALPLAVFWLKGWIEPRWRGRLLGLLVLGGSQGALGWYMVASGLAERTSVSQYRLAAHLALACTIFAAILWVARSMAPERRPAGAVPGRLAYWLVPLVLLQIGFGGLVAGLNAGMAYNTWPLMDGHLIPSLDNLYVMHPAWSNHFENALTVQFQHRMLAYAILALAVWHAVSLWRAGGGRAARRATALAGIVAVQAGIGIVTLLLVVPLHAALLHQAWAVVVLSMTVVHAQASSRERAAASPGALPTGALAAA